MSACAKRQCGTRAHKAQLYKIEDKVVKINQAIHDVFSLSLLYILPWFEAQLPIGFEYEPRGFGHFGLIFDQNLPSFENRVLVRIELRGAIVELARKTKMASGFWSCEHCIRSLTFMLTRPQS